MIKVTTEITEIKKGQFTIRNRIYDAGTSLEVAIATFVVDLITKHLTKAMEQAGGGLEEIWSTRKVIPTRPEGEN